MVESDKQKGVWTYEITESHCKLLGNDEFPLSGDGVCFFAEKKIKRATLHKFLHQDVCTGKNISKSSKKNVPPEKK